MTLPFVVVFQERLGLKETRATKGTEERKERGVQLGRRENQALVPAHGVEPAERRFELFLSFFV